jgi:glycosyltransferase involved in cell wall biosynthesis
MPLPKFSVVTPCFNARRFLPETIASVLNQSAVLEGRCELQYIIVDGGSKDGTRDYLASLDDPRITWISEPDQGMYDAIAKGFEQATGDTMCYINAGDAYFPWAFDVASESFGIPGIDWITGLAVLRNERGQVFQVERARRYWSRLIQRGAYGARLPYIQQESTFWRASLWGSVDVARFRNMKLVGDYFLWVCMSRQATLHAVNSALAAFSIQPGQLSESKDRYFAEMQQLGLEPLSWRDRLLIAVDKLASALPNSLVRPFGYDNAIRYDLVAKQWKSSGEPHPGTGQ